MTIVSNLSSIKIIQKRNSKIKYLEQTYSFIFPVYSLIESPPQYNNIHVTRSCINLKLVLRTKWKISSKVFFFFSMYWFYLEFYSSLHKICQTAERYGSEITCILACFTQCTFDEYRTVEKIKKRFPKRFFVESFRVVTKSL